MGIHDLAGLGGRTGRTGSKDLPRKRRRSGFGGTQKRLREACAQRTFELLHVAVPCPGQDQRQQAQAQELKTQRHDQRPGPGWGLIQR